METFFQRTFKNADIQRMMIALGLISSLMPWYVIGYGNSTVSVSLLGAISSTDSMGLELAGALFYFGLAMCSIHKGIWTTGGVLCLISSAVIGWVSAGSIETFVMTTTSAGIGLCLGIIVIVFFFIVMLIRAREIYDQANARITKRIE